MSAFCSLSSNFATVGYHTALLSRIWNKYFSNICHLQYLGCYLHGFSPEGQVEVSLHVHIKKYPPPPQGYYYISYIQHQTLIQWHIFHQYTDFSCYKTVFQNLRYLQWNMCYAVWDHDSRIRSVHVYDTTSEFNSGTII